MKVDCNRPSPNHEVIQQSWGQYLRKVVNWRMAHDVGGLLCEHQKFFNKGVSGIESAFLKVYGVVRNLNQIQF